MSGHSSKKEAFSRVVIDAQLKDAVWNLTDDRSVRYEYRLPDGTFADYVLGDRHGRAMAVRLWRQDKCLRMGQVSI